MAVYRFWLFLFFFSSLTSVVLDINRHNKRHLCDPGRHLLLLFWFFLFFLRMERDTPAACLLLLFFLFIFDNLMMTLPSSSAWARWDVTQQQPSGTTSKKKERWKWKGRGKDEISFELLLLLLLLLSWVEWRDQRTVKKKRRAIRRPRGKVVRFTQFVLCDASLKERERSPSFPGCTT